MYRVPVEFTVRKTNKDSKAISSGFLDVKIEDNFTYTDFRSLMKAFNIHWKDEKGLRKGISRIQKTVTYLESQLEKASLRDHTTVESLQGPNGVPSFKTVSTLKELLKGLEKLKSNVKNINPSFLASMKTKSLTTMPNEHLHASMRERYPMPTQLQFCQALVPVIEESVKRSTETNFRYFTSRNCALYETPSTSASFSLFPKMEKPDSKTMSRHNMHKMNRFIKEFGEPNSMLTVRQRSTKDNPGTLPISAYGAHRPQLSTICIGQFLSSSTIVKNCLFCALTADICIALKIHLIGPFVLLKTEEDLPANAKSIQCELFMEDPADCMQYNMLTTCNIPINRLMVVTSDVCIKDQKIMLQEGKYEELLTAINKIDLDDDDEDDDVSTLKTGISKKGRRINIPLRFKT